ncbi:hypothetical protein JL720_12820 [Aureococcus anophagefferens]|nr:hypothetical protein JL720_12820 [Aureococcus anophagefferens]
MRALWWLLGTVAAAIPKIPKQVVQYGRFRTASTLQYQSLCAIMHLVHGADGAVACHHLARVDARGVPLTAPGAARGDRHTYRPQPLPRLAAGEVAAAYKTHFRFDERNDRDVWVFATTNGTDDTGPLAALGYDVKLVQSTAELFDGAAGGASRRSSASATARCASSTTTRATGIFCASAAAPRSRAACETYDLGAVEAALLNTHIFRTYGRRSRVLRSLSVADGDLNGTYCAASAAHMATRGYLPSRKRLVGFLTDAQAPEAGLYRPRRDGAAPRAQRDRRGEARARGGAGSSFRVRLLRLRVRVASASDGRPRVGVNVGGGAGGVAVEIDAVAAAPSSDLLLPCVARSQSSFMGLGDLVAYTFVGLIVAVFIFQLVDTAQTAKRKLVAKKND